MRKIMFCAVLGVGLNGCTTAAERASLDDAKCQSYGSRPGDPAYVTCRSQLDAARTQARATAAAALVDMPAPTYQAPAAPPSIMPSCAVVGRC